MVKEIRDPELSLHITAWEMIQRLQPMNAVIFHPANGEIRDKATANKLKLMGVMAGIADFVVKMKAGGGFIELKAPKGSLSSPQVRLRETCALIGIPYYVCRSVEEVIDSLCNMGVKFEYEINFEERKMERKKSS